MSTPPVSPSTLETAVVNASQLADQRRTPPAPGSPVHAALAALASGTSAGSPSTDRQVVALELTVSDVRNEDPNLRRLADTPGSGDAVSKTPKNGDQIAADDLSGDNDEEWAGDSQTETTRQIVSPETRKALAEHLLSSPDDDVDQTEDRRDEECVPQPISREGTVGAKQSVVSAVDDQSGALSADRKESSNPPKKCCSSARNCCNAFLRFIGTDPDRYKKE